MSLLTDLAATCADALRLRVSADTARRHTDLAQTHSTQAGTAFDRSRLLLRASAAMAATSTADDVVEAVRTLVTGNLNPAYVGVSLLRSTGQVDLRSGVSLPSRVAERWRQYDQTAATPSALAARTGAPLPLPDLTAVETLMPDALDTFLEMGWQSAASVPCPGVGGWSAR